MAPPKKSIGGATDVPVGLAAESILPCKGHTDTTRNRHGCGPWKSVRWPASPSLSSYRVQIVLMLPEFSAHALKGKKKGIAVGMGMVLGGRELYLVHQNPNPYVVVLVGRLRCTCEANTTETGCVTLLQNRYIKTGTHGVPLPVVACVRVQ